MVPFVIFFLVFLLIAGLAIYYHRRRVKYKKDVVFPVLESIFGTLEYGEMDGFSKERIFDTKLVNRGNTFYSEDYIKTTYKGVELEFADVKISQVTSTGKTTTTTVYFDGQWMIVKPKRKIDGRLYIIDRNFYYSNPRGMFIFKDDTLEKEEMESVEFNKEFNVYAESGHEAFYVLTPQKLLDLLEIHKENVSFYFNDDELHIAIYSKKNLFEPSFLGSNSIEEQRDLIKDSMMNVLKYVDVFEVEKKEIGS